LFWPRASAKLASQVLPLGHPLASGAGCKGGSVDLNGSTGPFPFVDHAAPLFFIPRHADGFVLRRRRWCGAGCSEAFRTARPVHDLLTASANASPLARHCGPALGLGVEKLTAQMTADQRGALAVFESMGFRGEALLRDQVKDRDGVKHDLVILGHDVARLQAQMQVYGLTEAF
jgi:hypothetical protein